MHEHDPHAIVAPQPSGTFPHRPLHACGTHTHAPPEHVVPGVHDPQSSALPHPSLAAPQERPWEAHVAFRQLHAARHVVSEARHAT